MMSDQFGPYRINPAFDRFPAEARLIGKLLAGFGEVELSVCRNAGHAVHLLEDVLKALYRLRTTSSRIDAADALARPRFTEAGLVAEYQTAHTMVASCLQLRNQFGHCNWGDAGTPDDGLFFADLQASATATEGFEHAWKHVDVPLLRAHERYFAATMEWLSFIHYELRAKRGSLPPGSWPKPPALERPPSITLQRNIYLRG